MQRIKRMLILLDQEPSIGVQGHIARNLDGLFHDGQPYRNFNSNRSQVVLSVVGACE